MISVAQLEPAATTVAGGASDPYGRRINPEPPPIHNESDDTEVDRILKKRITRGKLECLLKWKDWGNEYSVWYMIEDLSNAMDLGHDFERKQALTPAATRRRGKGARQAILAIQAPLCTTEGPKRGRGRGRPRKNG